MDIFEQMQQAASAPQQDSVLARMQSAASGTPSVPMAAPDPTGNFGENFAAGIGKFATDTAVGSKQLLNDAAAGLQNATPPALRDALDWINRKLGGGDPQAIQAQGRADIAESRRLDAPLAATGGGFLGQMAGGLMTAPLLPATGTMLGAGAAGAGLGAIQPAESWAERGANVGLGGVAGGATQGVLNGLGRTINPNVSPDVRALLAEGITPTPGQIAGGAWKRAEEGLTSIPVLGDSIKAAQGRGIDQLNTAAFNRALAPINEKLPSGMAGRDAVDYVESALGSRYDQLLPKLTTQADQQFGQDIAGLRSMVANGAIDPSAAKSFNRILQNDVLGKFQGQGVVTGQTLKDIESDLGQHIKRFGASSDADQRLVGDALQETQATLRSLVQRTNPQYAPELSAINAGWANFKRVQTAGGGIGADAGTFTPAHLQSAVRANDPSKDKAAFARGSALMQDLSDPAKSVLAPKLPDSGTPYRGLLSALTAAGGAAALGHTGAATGIALGAALGPTLYSAPAQKALAALLTKRGAGAKLTADELQYLAPLLSGGAAIGAVNANK